MVNGQWSMVVSSHLVAGSTHHSPHASKKVGKVNCFISYMKFRKFTADYLFTGYQMVKDAVLITDDQGVIDNIVPFNEAGGDVETSHGILTPG